MGHTWIGCRNDRTELEAIVEVPSSANQMCEAVHDSSEERNTEFKKIKRIVL